MMTLSESAFPDEASAPAGELVMPVVAPIDVDTLDKENRGWVLGYLAQLRDRLQGEQAAAQPDFVMIAYLKREVATYQELLDRTDANPG